MLAYEIAQSVREKKSFAKEIAENYISKAKTQNERLNAFISFDDTALQQAEEVQTRLEGGEDLPLAGVPVALKDNISTKGLATTCGSKFLSTYVPPFSATVVNRLKKAGAILIGKTNMDEFAMGSSTEYSAFGPSKNPWNTDYVPGGTSGGSAVAVAADLAPLALGTDTGGSVRQPASLCGVYGFKPTYGRVSRYGVVATASSLDQIGTFGRTLQDLAMLSDVVSGFDTNDSTSLEIESSFRASLDQSVKGKTIGIIKEAMQAGNSDGVSAAIANFTETLEAQGVRVVEVSLPSLKYALSAYYIVNTAEISSNLARYDGTLYGMRVEGEDIVSMMMKTRDAGLGPEVKKRILMGTFALSSGYYDAYYGKALKVRSLLKNDFEKAFLGVDALLTPTSPFPAFKFGEKTGDPLSMYLADIDTVAVSLVGLPALSVPAGFENGLPVGVQLIGRALEDEVLFSFANAFELATARKFCEAAKF